MKIKADKATTLGFNVEASMWKATGLAYEEQQTKEVKAVMMALYAAFNRKNYDELRALWLPDDYVEVTFPGYEKAVSYGPFIILFFFSNL